MQKWLHISVFSLMIVVLLTGCGKKAQAPAKPASPAAATPAAPAPVGQEIKFAVNDPLPMGAKVGTISPDGTQIAIVANNRPFIVERLNPATIQFQSTGMLSSRDVPARPPVWSPDGMMVSFSGLASENNPGLTVLWNKTTNQEQFVRGLNHTVFSPNGRQLIGSNPSEKVVAVIDLNTNGVRPFSWKTMNIPDDAIVDNFNWVDNSRVYFLVRSEGAPTDVYQINPGSGQYAKVHSFNEPVGLMKISASFQQAAVTVLPTENNNSKMMLLGLKDWKLIEAQNGMIGEGWDVYGKGLLVSELANADAAPVLSHYEIEKRIKHALKAPDGKAIESETPPTLGKDGVVANGYVYGPPKPPPPAPPKQIKVVR